MLKLSCYALVLAPAVCVASFPIETTKTCPIGGQVFAYVSGGVGATVDAYLDGQPEGASLPSYPVCPDNGFVMFADRFSAAELSQLKTMVESPQYQTLRGQHTTHFLAATLMRAAGWPTRAIAHALLVASWEAPTRDLRNKYREKALIQFKASLLKQRKASGEWARDQLIAIDLERTLGLFAAASARIKSVEADRSRLPPDALATLSLQRELVALQNTAPRLRSSASR
jgi:hypothetical protein